MALRVLLLALSPHCPRVGGAAIQCSNFTGMGVFLANQTLGLH